MGDCGFVYLEEVQILAYSGYNEAKKKCNQRYIDNNNLVQMKITLKAEKKAKIVEAAKTAELSITQYIIDAVTEKMDREGVEK